MTDGAPKAKVARKPAPRYRRISGETARLKATGNNAELIVTRGELKEAINLVVQFTLEATLLTNLVSIGADPGDMEAQKAKVDEIAAQLIALGYLT